LHASRTREAEFARETRLISIRACRRLITSLAGTQCREHLFSHRFPIVCRSHGGQTQRTPSTLCSGRLDAGTEIEHAPARAFGIGRWIFIRSGRYQIRETQISRKERESLPPNNIADVLSNDCVCLSVCPSARLSVWHADASKWILSTMASVLFFASN